MRVLFLTRKWPPAIGGMETYSVELTHELKREVDLTVYALPGRPDGTTPRPVAILGFAIRTGWRLLWESRHDVIHGADMAIWPLALLARLRSPGAAIVLSAHGSDVVYPARRGWRSVFYGAYMRLGARLLRRATVVANSGATETYTRAIGFLSVEVIPLGTRAFGRAAPVEAPGTFILFAGRLLRQKGFAWFATEVMPQLSPEITLKVAGTVWDENERAALDSDRVTYLGPLDQGPLGDLMAEAICVVIPNIPTGQGFIEGFGLVAVETAMAGGVVLASRMDGFTDSVLDNLTGFLVAPMSAPDWIAKIDEVASWPADVRRAFTDRASAKARAHFSWERVARETIEVYRAASG